MKSKRQCRLLAARPERRGARDQSRVAHRHQDRLGGQHGREQRHDRADAEREGEALDVGGREHEQDERGHDRDHVRVDDRRQALAVAGRDPLADRPAGAYLLLDAFEDDDVGVRGDADRQDQAGDARERQRDRDQLDQRVEVEPRRRPARRSRSRRARGSRRSGRSRRRAGRPGRRSGPGAAPACRASPTPVTRRSA